MKGVALAVVVISMTIFGVVASHAGCEWPETCNQR